MAFNQVSPLSQQFSTQQRVPDFHQTQQTVQNFPMNQFYGPYSENQTHRYGNSFHSYYNGANQFNSYEQREFEHEVHSLKNIEYQIENVRQSLQQDVVSGNNSQVSRQINEFVLTLTKQTREFIQQVIRMTQQRQNQVIFPNERQAYQQRGNQLLQLAQIKDHVHQLIQQRMNSFDYNNNQQAAQRVMHLIHQAQDLIRDIINQVESHMSGRGYHWSQFNSNHRNNNQSNTQYPLGVQNYQDSTYQRGGFSSMMGQFPRSDLEVENKDENWSLVQKVLVFLKSKN